MPEIFASDAGRWVSAAMVALLVAGVALLGDRRRMRRSHPDRVGFMPWAAVFLLALFVAAVTGAMALKVWLAPV